MQPSNKFEHILTKDYLQEEYVNKKRSATKIGKEHGINHVTVLRYIRMHGFDIGIRNGQLEPGMVFNRLTTVKKHNVTKNGTVRWECLCECGNITYVMTSELKRNVGGRSSTLSCGCAKKGHKKKNPSRKGKESPYWVGCGDISGNKWANIKHGALSRNIEINISIEEAWKIFKNQEEKCYLSGLKLDFLENRTASLDRINSNLGYTLENCRWCHKDVNRMKYTYTKEKFVDYCVSMYLFNNNFKYKYLKEISDQYIYSLCEGAKKRNLNFSITKKDILKIFRKQGGLCALTGTCIYFAKDNKGYRSRTQTASIDRINNKVGYDKDNIHIVHKDINMSRGSFELNYYKEICKLIAIHNS